MEIFTITDKRDMLVYYWIIIGNLGYNNKSDLSLSRPISSKSS